MPTLLGRIGFVRTRFARRTLLAFLSAALLPSAVAAGVWFQRLRTTLDAEADADIASATRSASVALLERLDLLTSRAFPESGGARSLGATRLLVRATGGAPVIAVARTVAANSTARPDTVSLAADELWAALDQLIDGEGSGYCVLVEQARRPLYCSAELPATFVERASAVALRAEPERIHRLDGWRFTQRELFLRAQYHAPSWYLLVARSDAPIAARLREETRYFLIIGALALVAAFALSHVQLRRQTAPIERLQRATRAVREGRFDTQVEVPGNDEFTEFGDTFNAMTRTLQQQFRLLGDVDALNERALQGGGEAGLVTEALARLGARTSASLVGLALIDADDPQHLTYHTRRPGASAPAGTGSGRLSASCRALLHEISAQTVSRALLPQTTLIDATRREWHDLSLVSALVIPLRAGHELLGAVVLGLGATVVPDDVAIDAERRLAERLALGLTNARLVAQLDALSLGTLRAFGSTIDANSKWTAGHSERVTRVAVQLGDALGVSAAERVTLTRGCLLHDIGKIGIPAVILDKNGRLTDEEFAIIRRHPEIGADILSAVPAFRDLLPIVRSHHERLDGRGYPDGLRGDEIPQLARIATVADVFDALVSARPYRPAMPISAVRSIITGGRGTHFDPLVVDAMDTLLADGQLVVPDHVATPLVAALDDMSLFPVSAS